MPATYNLGALAHAAGHRRLAITIPPIGSRNADREALRRIIVGVADGGADERARLLRLAVAAQSAITMDDIGLNDGLREFRQGQQSRLGRAVGAIRGWISRIAARFDLKWAQTIKATLGVDIAPMVQAGDLQGVVALVTQKLATTIRAIADDVANRIEAGLIELITRGASTKEKAAALVAEVARSRKVAEAAARRETEVVTTVLNQFRQQQAGVTQYEWWTRQDERVRGTPKGLYPRARPSHYARHGKIYRWDRPPNEGKYDGAPGEPPNCRCVARALVVPKAQAIPETPQERARREGLEAVSAVLDPGRARREGLAAVSSALGLFA